MQTRELLDRHRQALRGHPCSAGLLHQLSASLGSPGLSLDLAPVDGVSIAAGEKEEVPEMEAGQQTQSLSLLGVSDSPASWGVVEPRESALSLWLHAVAVLVQASRPTT